jgi:tRNA(His) 5'-end guanylyltransferase
VSAKHELLFQPGINWNNMPAWQRRGAGIYWQPVEKLGFNPKSGEQVATTRRRLAVDEELPVKDAYSAFLRRLLASLRIEGPKEA